MVPPLPVAAEQKGTSRSSLVALILVLVLVAVAAAVITLLVVS
jgi:flagellar basal body-associated protein FliL